MQRTHIGLMIVAAVSVIGLAPTLGSHDGAVLAAPQAIRESATLTGLLVERVFIQDCKCYPWVIEKNNTEWEVDVSAVMREARALVGHRVKTTGVWSKYVRDGQTIRFFKIRRLERA